MEESELIQLKEVWSNLHQWLRNYAWACGVDSEKLSLDVSVWGHHDASPSMRLYWLEGGEEYLLAEVYSLNTHDIEDQLTDVMHKVQEVSE